MKNKLLKSITSVSLSLSMITPVLAATPSTSSVSTDISNIPVIGQDSVQKKESEYYTPSEVEDDNTTSVYATLSSTFNVIIPKTVILNGVKNIDNKNVGNYSVNVTDDLGGQEKVLVMPDKTFNIKQSGKTDITTSVEQDIIE